MKNTYLVEVISVLSTEEQQDFSQFLANSFYNKGGQSNELQHLYAVILAAAPEYADAVLEKNLVYNRVFPGKDFIEGKLEKLMTDLNKLLRKFLLTKTILEQEDSIDNQLTWIRWLREHGMESRFQQAVNKIKTKIQSRESLDSYQLTFQLAKEEHEWASTYNRIKGDLNIANLLLQLDLYYYNYRTELSNRFLLQEKAGKIIIQDQLQTPLNQLPPQSLSQKSALLLITQKINILFNQEAPEEQAFQAMVELIDQHKDALAYQTVAELYAYIRSLCVLLIDNGHLNFVKVLHDIHKQNVKDGYLLAQGKMGANTYLNLVQIAIRAKETDWAIQFTEEYKNLITDGDETRFFYKYSLACCLFANKQYDKALDLLVDPPPSPYYHLMVRRLELKIYYEQDSELLPYKIDAFRKYLERTAPKSVSTQNNDMNMNFVSMLSQISQSPRKDAKRAARLVDRINAKKAIGERSWLLEKARELG